MNKRTPKPRKYNMRRTAGNLNDKVDRTLLHQYLWNHRDRSDFMTDRPGVLAEELGVTPYTMSRIFGEMVAKGYLKKIGRKYLIISPDIAAWNTGGAAKQESMF